MTTPTPAVTASKAKAWTALIGSVLSALVPLVLQVSTALPPPWPALAGGLVALLTMFGVYHAPYKPADTVLVPKGTVPIASGNPDTGSFWPSS